VVADAARSVAGEIGRRRKRFSTKVIFSFTRKLGRSYLQNGHALWWEGESAKL
jgi:hypothetical protein